MISIENFGNKNITGRLGNQIFQFAFVFALYKKYNYKISLPIIKDAQFWKCFKILDPIIHPYDDSYFKITIYENQGSCNYDKSLIANGDNYIYSGFFQSYKYFDKYKNELIKTLKFKNHIKQKGDLKLSKYKNNLVSIHVRRTDYLKSPIWGDLIKEGYYEKATYYIKDSDDVLVFSDDINFTKEYFKNKKNYYIIDENEYVSLYMMTQCNSHIIANSTFSWMGAYLSGKENITCPDPWWPSFFPKPNNVQKDITKEGWRKINVFQ